MLSPIPGPHKAGAVVDSPVTHQSRRLFGGLSTTGPLDGCWTGRASERYGFPVSSEPAKPESSHLGDVVATVVLIIGSIGLAVGLFFGVFLWDTNGATHALGFFLGVFVPPVLTVLGVIGGIVALVRRRLAFVYPLAGILLSLLSWWIAQSLATA